jgi:hypothetical protein
MLIIKLEIFIMKNINFVSKASSKLILLLGVLGLMVLTACGGGSSGGYKASDDVDRAPYFSVAGSAVKNGASIDASKREKMPVELFDDKSLKSYHITIDGETVAEGDASGTTAIVEVDLAAYNGDQTYSAKVLAVDSANNSTVAYFTLNVKEFYDYVAMIGDATAAGWTNTAAVPLEQHATIEGRFTWTGHLNPGAIKFALAPIPDDWCCIEWIMPEADQQSVTNPAMKVFPSGGPDYKWQVPVAGEYTIVIDQKTQKVYFGAPAYELGMVGDATVAGWNLNGAVRFERDAVDPMVFTTVTDLAATGSEQAVKLFGQANGENYEWSNGIWIFAPSSAADLPTEAPGPIVVKIGENSSADDLKWKVSPEKAGTYLIRVNFKDNTILFTKQN